MGQITATRNLVAIKVVRHAGQLPGRFRKKALLRRHQIMCWYHARKLDEYLKALCNDSISRISNTASSNIYIYIY